MPAGASADGKARYRERIKQGQDPTRSLPRREFEEVEVDVQWIADAEGTVQQMQVTKRAVVLSLSIPLAYAKNILEVQQHQGSVVFMRFYLPPDPFADMYDDDDDDA